jgi:hypothetical protein
MRILNTALGGLLVAGLVVTSPAIAEDEAEAEAEPEEQEEAAEENEYSRFDLPNSAKEAREAGLDADVVVAVIDAVVEAELKPADAAWILASTAPLVEEHGPVEEYGALVAHKLGQGLRGAELVASLAEAHETPDAGAATSPKSKKPTPNIGRKPNFKNARPLNPKPVKPGNLTRPGSNPRPKPSGGGGGGGRGGGGGLTRPGGAR